MHVRGIVVAMLVSVLAALLLVPVPAVAGPVQVGQSTIFDTRPAGMPATTEAWRTLSSVSGETDWRTGEVAVTASLRDYLPPGGTVSVTWTIGHWSSPGVCAPEHVITEAPTEVAGTFSVSAVRTVSGLARDYDCLDVTLTTQGAVTDRMRDAWAPRIFYSGAEADLASGELGSTRPTKVLAGRPTRTILLVTSHVLASSRVTVTGSGTAALAPVTVTGLAADEVRPVVARVTAPARGRHRLDLQARDDRGDTDYDGRSSVKGVPVHGRPGAGTFRSADGAVKLEVDRSGRVRRLVGTVGTCGTGAPTTVRMRTVAKLPRTGATAVATRAGAGWSAVSLVTTNARAISGVLVRTTPGCLLQVPFVVRRAR